jgi:hypothetical protein
VILIILHKTALAVKIYLLRGGLFGDLRENADYAAKYAKYLVGKGLIF